MTTIRPALTRFLLVCASLGSWVAPPLHAQARFGDSVRDMERVVELIDQRLALMPNVAAYKWRLQEPIVDAAREQAVLDRSVADATALQLDGAGARQFFTVQIRMARLVQARCFERWRATNSPALPAVRDLSSDLRPQLDAIGGELLKAVYLASGEWSGEGGAARLDTLKRHGVNDEMLKQLREALAALQIRQAPSWATIQRVGVLRIGTTGDYAPFSVEGKGVLSGFDVWLAESLASHLGVQTKFVRTSWPTLMQDFGSHHFDLGMSGISVTAERRARANFSTVYHLDGKTPISLCSNAHRFQSLEQIDRPEVRVVANPGGTNERFVRERIKQAMLIMHDDNRTIFDELVAGRADVMVTDGIEVQLQTLRHPELCGTMQMPMTRADKAIMVPEASELTRRINAWLAPQIASGQLQEHLRREIVQAR